MSLVVVRLFGLRLSNNMLFAVMCAFLVPHCLVVSAQTSGSGSGSGPVDPSTGIPYSVLGAMYSVPPGAWLVSDSSSTVLSNKSSVLSIGLVMLLPGGAKGYLIPPTTQIGSYGTSLWCQAGGIAMAMMETNCSPDMLPNHKLQLVLSNDNYSPAKSFISAQDVYSLPRSDSPIGPNLTWSGPVELVIGGLSFDISRSIATVAKYFNRPFVAVYTDPALLPPTHYPTLVSKSVSYDVIASAAAQFAHEQGWERVATLTSLGSDAVADGAHFAKACASLGISVATRETFDESQGPQPGSVPGTTVDSPQTFNPSLDAAVARLKASDVRIMYLGCAQTLTYIILAALDRAGLVGPRYVQLASNCINGLAYTNTGTGLSAQRKRHLLSGIIGVQSNTFIPDDPTRVARFNERLMARYQAAPESLFNCDPTNPINANILTIGYESALPAIQAMHMLQQTKQQCQQPDNQLRLQQAMPMSQVKALGSAFNCRTAMTQSTWNTSLAIDCCRLDPVRSPYYRPPSPFGDESYVNGDGPVLLDMLRSVRMTGITGPIGIQRPDAPLASLLVMNYLVDMTGATQATPRFIYRSTQCNAILNVCTWNQTSISTVTYGDGTTTIPDDGIIRYVETIAPNNIGRGIFVGLAVLGMCAIGVASVLMWHHRSLKSIKSSSITFVMLILFAAAAGLSTIMSLYHDDSVSSCRARVWLGHVSFAVLFGSLLLKTYRLANIFANRALRVKAKSDSHLLVLLAIYVLSVSAILVSWMARAAPTVVFQMRADRRAGYYTCQSSSYVEMWVLLGVHSLALVWGIYLCIKSQDVFAELNESKQIALSIYNVSLLSAIIVAIDQGLSYFSVDMTFYVYAVGILLGSITTVSLLVANKLTDIHQRNNKQRQVQRQQHAKTVYSDSQQGTGTANELGSGRKRSVGSVDSSRRVSDLGLGVTPTDWMKLTVFTRKCHEATTANNIGRLMMEQNKLFALLMQIYNDATPNGNNKQAQGQHNENKQTDTVTAPDTAPDSSTVTSTSTVPSRPTRQRGSVSSGVGVGVGPFDVNESGVRIDATAGSDIRGLFNMHQLRAQQHASNNNNKTDSIQLHSHPMPASAARHSIDSTNKNTNSATTAQQLELDVEPLFGGHSGSPLEDRARSSSMMESPHQHTVGVEPKNHI